MAEWVSCAVCGKRLLYAHLPEAERQRGAAERCEACVTIDYQATKALESIPDEVQSYLVSSGQLSGLRDTLEGLCGAIGAPATVSLLSALVGVAYYKGHRSRPVMSRALQRLDRMCEEDEKDD